MPFGQLVERSMKGLWPAEAADGVVCMCMWILIFIMTQAACVFLKIIVVSITGNDTTCSHPCCIYQN